MTLGDLIKKYRTENGYSMDDFSAKSGLSKAYISILERNRNSVNGKPVTPSLETIKAVSSAINIDFNDVIAMLDGDQEVSLIPPGFEPLPRMKKKPLIGSIACGAPILAEENIEDYVEVPEEIRCEFCLRCKGNSMIDAGIQDGDIVFIRVQHQIENGEIAAVRINDEATLKRVYWDDNSHTLVLVSANASIAPMTFKCQALNDIHIEGKAVGFTHWF